MTDQRCPLCDQLVAGRQEVIQSKPKNPASQCQHCKNPVVLTWHEEGAVSRWYYESNNMVRP